MFDNSFLFAALETAPVEKRLLLLSIRGPDEFAVFARAGWNVAIAGLMATDAVTTVPETTAFFDNPADALPVSVILGDLAAFRPEHLAVIEREGPAVVKANIVTSPIDGGAFLLPDGGGDESLITAAADLIEVLDRAGYACWISTWYRNDVMPHMWELDARPEKLTARLRGAFPFNIVGFREPVHGRRMAHLAEVFKHQRSLFDPHRESYP